MIADDNGKLYVGGKYIAATGPITVAMRRIADGGPVETFVDGVEQTPPSRTAQVTVRVVPDGVSRAEHRRFLKALAKKQKQARCREHSP